MAEENSDKSHDIKHIHFKLLDDALLPEKMEIGTAYDLKACNDVEIPSQEVVTIDTKVQIYLEDNLIGIIMGRSGHASKGLYVHTGLIDTLFTGTLKIIIFNLSQTNFKFRRNARVAQLLILEQPTVAMAQVKEIASKSSRNDQCLGSTGTY